MKKNKTYDQSFIGVLGQNSICIRSESGNTSLNSFLIVIGTFFGGGSCAGHNTGNQSGLGRKIKNVIGINSSFG